jgi:single-strand DNA-binding protein
VNGITAAVTGRITTDPEEKFTASGKALVTFSLVVDVAHPFATEDKAAPPATFLRVTAWEPSEELLEQLRRGVACYVEGKLTHGTWTAQDGTPRCGMNLSAWRVDGHGAIGKRPPRRAIGAVQ